MLFHHPKRLPSRLAPARCSTPRTATSSSTGWPICPCARKDGLVRALLGRARADELDVLDGVRRAGGAGGLSAAAEAIWTWLAAPEHQALLTLWLEGYARSVVDPDGPLAGFATATVHDWLAVLEDAAGADGGDVTDRTLLLAVLRGAVLDLLATGDVDRVSAAVARHLRPQP